MGIIFRIRKSPFLSSVAVGCAALCVGFLFIILTDPGNISLAALLLPFALLGIAVFALTNALVLGFFHGVVSTKIRRFLSVIASFLVVTMLLLQSLNQFTFRDLLILVVLVATLGIYVARADFRSN
jgi:hypothetical protein